MSSCTVTFHPGKRAVSVPEGTDLLTAAIAADVHLYNACGGEGICRECRVVVRKGEVSLTESGRLEDEWVPGGEGEEVLACRAQVRSDVQVAVSPESIVGEEQILVRETGRERFIGSFSSVDDVSKGVELETRHAFQDAPLTLKRFLKLSAPTIEDNISDLDRLYREIRRLGTFPKLYTEISLVRGLGSLLRKSNWEVTVTLARQDGFVEILAIEPGDASNRNFGLVLDIGTTTLVASLVDLQRGETLGSRATRNPQRNYGEDVIARLIFAERSGGLESLRQVVVDTTNKLIEVLASEYEIDLNDITAMVCAGNTTMSHIFLGLDPYYLRRDPYVPTAQFLRGLRASDAGVHIHPRGVMSCLPGVASYVGGDITAGVIASGLYESDDPCMLIDIGTNGEIVLGNRDWLVCSSASAGPAFEGSGVTCGMRAMGGAIQRVKIDPITFEPTCSTIGDGEALGICGSGYIDLVAELFETGLTDKQGALNGGSRTPRIREGDQGLEYVLARDGEKGDGRSDIRITQADIQHLVRSKGSIYAATKVMADKVGLALRDIQTLFIGGGFGNFLDVENAIRIGLLPDLPRERFAFIGNSSLAGARIALRSEEGLEKAWDVADRMTNLELCAEPAYMGEYVSSLFLPHTDIDLFPTVKQKMGV